MHIQGKKLYELYDLSRCTQRKLTIECLTLLANGN